MNFPGRHSSSGSYWVPVGILCLLASLSVMDLWGETEDSRATWCGPCKSALPEISAFERARDIPVIAITDEPSEKLDAFFQGYQGPFPRRVAVDEFRHSFVDYGVSGTPSFVLIDAQGSVQSISVGSHQASTGLGIADWSWVAPEQGSGGH